jgi:SAM-dependent methyltransferase
MSIEAIQRQYNEVVAPHYDLDPQEVIGRSLQRAISQLQQLHLFEDALERLQVLDVGMGTGRFLEKLVALGDGRVQPFGLDLAEKMVDVARGRLPDLVAEVDDAANLDACFPGQSFDLVCTHFITGFVPTTVLAPQIWNRLEEGGYWSLVGGTKAGFPAVQKKADTWLVRQLCGAGSRRLADVLLNPADREEVEQTLQGHGFEICLAETFQPEVDFPNFDEFMEFAHRGGWFTPLVEAVGLHEANALTRWLFDRFVFPVKDHHDIAVVLARKAENKNGR